MEERRGRQQIRNLQRTNNWTKKGARRVDHHRGSQLVPIKQVADSTAGDTEKRTADQTIEEAADEHGLYVVGDSAWN